MGFETKYITPHIKLSLYEGKQFKTEVVFEHHILVWFISGETRLFRLMLPMFLTQETSSLSHVTNWLL
jgi:hypothetical protein